MRVVKTQTPTAKLKQLLKNIAPSVHEGDQKPQRTRTSKDKVSPDD